MSSPLFSARHKEYGKHKTILKNQVEKVLPHFLLVLHCFWIKIELLQKLWDQLENVIWINWKIENWSDFLAKY